VASENRPARVAATLRRVPIEISQEDVAKAEELLAAVVTEGVPDGDFAKLTANRELVIKGLSVVAAQLRAESGTARSLQSLRGISALANSPNRNIADDLTLSDAADAWLSNWFASRSGGAYSRGEVLVSVSRRMDYIVERTRRFQYDQRYGFYPDYATDIIIAAQDLQAVYDARGVVAFYTFPLRLVAAATGSGYNVSPGNWAGTGGFSNYILRVSNTSTFSGGDTQQSTGDFVRTASNAISVRNLVNAKSIEAVLPGLFPQIRRMLVVGMGDPEMQRDTAPALLGITDDSLIGPAALHLGGCVDIYCELPLYTTQFSGTIGGAYVRPDGIFASFGSTVSPAVDFVALGILAGDVLQLDPDVMEGRTDFLVVEVLPDEIRVSASPARAFPVMAQGLEYRVYRPMHGPDRNVYPPSGTASDGFTTNTTKTANRVGAPAGAFYDVIDVMVTNPDGSDPFIDPSDGYVHFTLRVEETPVMPVSGNFDTPLPYQVTARDPRLTQTARAFVEIGLPPEYNGKRVTVKYDGNTGFDAISTYVVDPFERTAASSPLVRAMHPAYLSMDLEFTQEANVPAVDVNKVAQAVVGYVNGFDPRKVMDVSDITTFAKNAVPGIDTLFPFNIRYQLIVPDGTTIDYETADRVVMSASKLVDTGVVRTSDELLRMGVSNRTTRYVTNLSRVSVSERLVTE
jgi:hypothetical protein